jgi:putative ABC transport system substrate-binding protein
MRRREFITLLGGAAATWPLAARAQQDGRVRRVGVLMGVAATQMEYLSALVQEMRRLGWNEGQNLRLDVRWNAEGGALSHTYAVELIGLMPDVIVTGSTVNLAAVQQVTKTIPIVFVSVADPVTQGFVSNMRQPGGNVTGFSLLEFSLGAKWLNLLKEIAPRSQAGCSGVQSRHGPILQVFRAGVRCRRAAAWRAGDQFAGTH